MSSAASSVPASGGNGAIGIAAARECAWSSSIEGAWLSIKAGASGQGDGTVEFAAAANPDPQARTGAVVVNGSRAQITQSAGECVITLDESSADLTPAGGAVRIGVVASSPLCAWTASADAPWIEITSGVTGRGSAPVMILVAPTSGPPRAGAVTIGGQRFNVTQSQGCTYAIDRSSDSVPASGGGRTVAVATAAACPWTAASNVDWVTLTPPTGTGAGAVTVTVAGTQSSERTGTAVIAGQLFTITQSAGCDYQVQPAAHSIGASGGTAQASVGTASGCAWTATSNASWITVQGPATGNGSGQVTFAVAATSGPSRAGTLTVAGRQISVTQTQGCSWAISPQTQSVPSSGGNGTVTVTSGQGCAWTAASGASWATITAGSSGSGNGEVRFSVAATSGPARSTTLTIAGQTFTLSQGEGCSLSLSSSSVSIDNAGGAGSFDVQTASGCAWTAASSASWITISSGGSGSGTGTVRFTVAPNSGPNRSGSITAGGRTFTVDQGAGCTVNLSGDRQSVAAAGGSGSVNVTTPNGCGWTAASNAPWLTVTSGAAGSGNGSVGFTAAANAGPARTGTLTIAGRTFTVEQAGGCAYAISPAAATAPAGGGTVTTDVTAQAACAWTSSSNAPWITVASGASGTGNGQVGMTVEPNAGAQRSGTVTVAGQTFTITQADGCAYAISPAAATASAGGGTVTTDVTAQAACAWTSSSNAPWIAVASGASGTGNGQVGMTVEPNAGAQRSGTVTVAGQTFTITQESGCAYTVAPETLAVPAAGASARVDVTTSGGCGWTAVSSASWITVTAGATGTGSGPVDLVVDAHTGPARSATVAITGKTVTVSQDSGCTIALTPTSQTVPTTGGAGSVDVTASAGCTWTAVSSEAWIEVLSAGSGSGDGRVQFTVQANGSGAPRSGTIAIGGQTFTVNQQ